MPQYFFNVRDIPPTLDPVGEDFPNDETAWRQATTFAGEILRDIDGRFQPGQEWTLHVTDQGQSPVFEIHITSKKFR